MEVTREKVGALFVNGYKGDYIFETICKNGFYEFEPLQKWLPVVQHCRIILDIGANIGNHALYWATHLMDATIFAFEPFPDNAICLEQNIVDNQLEHRIFAVRKALGNKKQYAEVVSVDTTNLGATSFRSTSVETGIEITTVDIFVDENSIVDVDFIKIDTEGFELAVLAGMEDTLKRYSPIVWIEVSYDTYKEVNRILVAHQYSLVDAIGFNMLYVPASQEVSIDDFTADRFFDESLKYLERTNLYYQNYTKTKAQYDALYPKYQKANIQYSAINQKLNEANEKYRTATENHRLLQDRLRTQESAAQELSHQLEEANVLLKEANVQIKDLEKINQAYADELVSYVKETEEQIAVLQEINRLYDNQQAQIIRLNQEIAEYRRKLSRITDTWYGKIALKCFRLLKKLRNAIQHLGGR